MILEKILECGQSRSFSPFWYRHCSIPDSKHTWTALYEPFTILNDMIHTEKCEGNWFKQKTISVFPNSISEMEAGMYYESLKRTGEIEYITR